MLLNQTVDPTTPEFLGPAPITVANSLCESSQKTNKGEKKKILFGAIKPSSVVRSSVVFGKTFKENSVEILSMNRNVNVLGMYYVNPYSSGVLDKINGSKEQALEAAGEISLCVLCPLKARCRTCSPRGR